MMEKVRDDLFFGDIYDAAGRDLYELNEIDVVVKLCGIEPVSGYPESVEVVDMDMPDGVRNRFEEFSEAVDAVHEKLEAGETVFVHCAAGQSRSVCVAAAVHSILEGVDFDTGMERLRELRDVSPEETLLENGRKAVSEYSS